MGFISPTYIWCEASPFEASEFNENFQDFYGSATAGSHAMCHGLDSANFGSLATWPASQINVNDTNACYSETNVEGVFTEIGNRLFRVSANDYTNVTASTIQEVISDLQSQVGSANASWITATVRWAKPALVWLSACAITVRGNLDVSASGYDSTRIIFPGNFARSIRGSTIRTFNLSSTGNFSNGTAVMLCGMQAGFTADTSAFIFVHAVGVTSTDGGQGSEFALIGTPYTQIGGGGANTGIAQLNSQFGSGNWIYLGALRRGSAGVIKFKQIGNRTHLFDEVLFLALRPQSQAGTAIITFDISRGLSGNNIPDAIDIVTLGLGMGVSIAVDPDYVEQTLVDGDPIQSYRGETDHVVGQSFMILNDFPITASFTMRVFGTSACAVYISLMGWLDDKV